MPVMRVRWLVAATLLAGVGGFSARVTIAGDAPRAVEAERASLSAAIADAARDLEIAQLRLRRYDRVEYPSTLRQLESQIKLAQAELEIWRHRVAEYAPFDRWVGSAPMLITLDDARLNVLRYERALGDLRDDRDALEHSRRDQLRLFELEAQSAAARLLKLRQALSRGVF